MSEPETKGEAALRKVRIAKYTPQCDCLGQALRDGVKIFITMEGILTFERGNKRKNLPYEKLDFPWLNKEFPMLYQPTEKNVLAAITYGSRLYGTDTPKSDFDFKAVYIPTSRELLLSKNLNVVRHRRDAEGNVVAESSTMPDGGWEAEHTPLHKFVADWFSGQAYAVEIVFAVLQGYAEGHAGWDRGVNKIDPTNRQAQFYMLCQRLQVDFRAKNVKGMVGFAMKQTFDYVKRGERLNAARAVLHEVNEVGYAWQEFHVANTNAGTWPAFRLDSELNGEKVIDTLARNTGLEIGSTLNNNKPMRTLKLNAREYLETTSVSHFETAVKKLIEQYGDRSTAAAETDVDWKSLSHAVRVYQQVLEYLETGWITFPRPNAENLLAIKQGQHSLESVKDLLVELDLQVEETIAASELPDSTQEQRDGLDDVLFEYMQMHVQQTY